MKRDANYIFQGIFSSVFLYVLKTVFWEAWFRGPAIQNIGYTQTHPKLATFGYIYGIFMQMFKILLEFTKYTINYSKNKPKIYTK